MKRGLVVLAAVAGLLVALVGVATFVADRYARSPAFVETVLAEVRAALGVDVQVRHLGISLFRGVTLDRVNVANPPGFAGDFLTADRLLLSYRLAPLFRGRLHVDELGIDRPTITLERGEEGRWNYARLGGAAADAPAAPAGGTSGPAPGQAGAPTAPRPRPAGPSLPPLDVELSRLTISHGTLDVRDARGAVLLGLREVNLESALRLESGALHGEGRVRIDRIGLGETLFLRGVTAPVRSSPDGLRLDPLTARLGGGDVHGTVELARAGGSPSRVELTAKGADVKALLEEARVQPWMSGRLEGRVALAGPAAGGLASLDGQGQVRVVDGTLTGFPLLTLVGELLQAPEVQNLRFRECRVDFVVRNGFLETPVIRVEGPAAQLQASGRMALADLALDHAVTLTLSRELMARLPRDARAVLAEGPDGSGRLAFHVRGSYRKPKTDVGERLGRAGAGLLIDRGIRKLLERLR